MNSRICLGWPPKYVPVDSYGIRWKFDPVGLNYYNSDSQMDLVSIVLKVLARFQENGRILGGRNQSTVLNNLVSMS